MWYIWRMLEIISREWVQTGVVLVRALDTFNETAVELVPCSLPSRTPPLSVLIVELQTFIFLEVQCSIFAVLKSRGSTIQY